MDDCAVTLSSLFHLPGPSLFQVVYWGIANRQVSVPTSPPRCGNRNSLLSQNDGVVGGHTSKHEHHTPTLGDQLDAQLFYIIRLFQSSTCFEQTRAHHQEINCVNTASGIVTLCKRPSGMHVEQELNLHTGWPLTE